MNVLLEIGADPNLKDSSDGTALHYALSAGSLPSVQLLLKHGANINAVDCFGRSTIQLALRSENVELVDFVLRVIEANPASVKRWLSHDDNFGRTVLHRLCLWNTTETGMMAYCTSEEDEALKGLAFEVDEPYAEQLTSFHVEKCAQLMHNLGADVNAQDIRSCTPLHLATKYGNAPAVRALLRFPDLKVNLEDERGLTALDWPVVDQREDIAEGLQRRGGKHSEGWQSRLKPLYSPWQEEAEENEGTNEWAIEPV
jgi:ankyrin repeat protein